MVAGAVLGGVAPTRGLDAAAGGILGLVTPLSNTFATLRYPMGAAFSSFIRALHPLTDSVFPLVLRAFPEGDRRVLSRPEMREMFVDDLKLGSSIGLHSVVSDLVLFTRPWGFLLRDIEVPVHFWQGDADPLVPFSHGAHQAALVRQSSLVHRPGEGHLGGLDQAEEAIESILQHWPSRRSRSARARRA
jgi:pimeloyl-ACP methyl ester carboxylesterase